MGVTIFKRVVLMALVALVGASCAGPQNAPGQGSSSAQGSSSGQAVVKVQGAGASFPAPLYSKWFKAYSTAHPGVQIDYQSVGSGSGVKAVIDHTVDFGASDAAMSPEEIAQVPGGVQLLPMTAGSIVLSYNLEGVPSLKLSRKAYSGIFLGTVKNWNDPAITSANPGVKLPDEPINVVVRADSSGTTYVFTKHLSAISPEFAKSPGTNKMPNWPVGTKSKGNEGVTASLKTTPGSIGYIEYGYAKSQGLAMATLENKSGGFVAPSTESGQAALASATLPDDLIVWASDPETPDAYPIVTYTWLILYKQYPDKKKLDVLQDLVKYALTDGQKESEALGYIPLPGSVVQKVQAAVGTVTAATADGRGGREALRVAETVPVAAAASVAQPPTSRQRAVNTAFLALCHVFAWLCLALVVYIVLNIAWKAGPALRERGLGFLVGKVWDPNQATYGILPEIWGTLYSSLLALLIGGAFGVAAAIFLSEGFLSQGVFALLKLFRVEYRPFWRSLPERVEDLLRNLIELLAAIPSVVYGLWGLFVVIPLIRPLANWLHVKLGWLPFFSTTLSGPGMLPAVLVLSIMILPTVTALSRDALVAVPSKLRMAAYGMGATRFETILAVILPTAARGVFGAIVLAFGRALGETMALAMLVGNANRISL